MKKTILLNVIKTSFTSLFLSFNLFLILISCSSDDSNSQAVEIINDSQETQNDNSKLDNSKPNKNTNQDGNIDSKDIPDSDSTNNTSQNILSNADASIMVNIAKTISFPNGSTINLDLDGRHKLNLYNPDNVNFEDLQNMNIEFWGNYRILRSTASLTRNLLQRIRIYDSKYVEYIQMSNFDTEEAIAIVRGKIRNYNETPNSISFIFDFLDQRTTDGTRQPKTVDIKKSPNSSIVGGEFIWRATNFAFFISNDQSDNPFYQFTGLPTNYIRPLEN